MKSSSNKQYCCCLFAMIGKTIASVLWNLFFAAVLACSLPFLSLTNHFQCPRIVNPADKDVCTSGGVPKLTFMKALVKKYTALIKRLTFCPLRRSPSPFRTIPSLADIFFPSLCRVFCVQVPFPPLGVCSELLLWPHSHRPALATWRWRCLF